MNYDMHMFGMYDCISAHAIAYIGQVVMNETLIWFYYVMHRWPKWTIIGLESRGFGLLYHMFLTASLKTT